MARKLSVAAAQLGPIHLADDRASVVRRLMEMLREAHSRGAEMVVFPELALTTFFPRYWYDDIGEIDAWFEREMPNEATRPLFDLARDLGVGFHLGYAELALEGGASHRYNTAILVGPDGRMVGKYRKVHLPGHADHRDGIPFQHLEKRYFEVGNLGFPVWRAFGGIVGMMICNDRRWPEAYRVMGLQGVELIALGYNTPTYNIYHPEPWHLRMFHNRLSVQAGAYQNGTWVVAAAKAGAEDGHGLIAGSCIVAPTGEIMVQALTEDDEVITFDCDLDLCNHYKNTVFAFEKHRRIEHYGLITSQTGVVRPPEGDRLSPEAPQGRSPDRREPLDASVRFYDTHPINEFEILAKLEADGISLEGLSEDVLQDYDQDHFGGLEAVQILAGKAAIDGSSQVLDVCSGMGGPARYLANRFGCRVTGLDITKSRHEGAIRLTERVGLAHLVDFRLGNALEMPFADASFDVVISQEAFVHVPDKPRLIAECARVVRPHGMIAFTDILRRDGLEPSAFARLQRDMATASLESLDGYRRRLEAAGCTVLESEDLGPYWTEILKQRLEMYRSLQDTTTARFGAEHFRRWDDTYAFFVGLFAAGQLGGGRFVARRDG